MATRAIKPKREDTLLSGWESMPESAPSVMRSQTSTLARTMAMVGMLFIAIGVLAIVAPALGWNYIVSPGWGGFFLSIGLGLVILHALAETDAQFRFFYGAIGLGLAGLAIFFRALPMGGGLGVLFLPLGIPFLTLALVLFLAVIRHESPPGLRVVVRNAIAAIGTAMIGAGFLLGQLNQSFLNVEGLLLLVLGLFYAAVLLGAFPAGSATPYHIGLLLGVVGLASFLIAAARSYSVEGFLVPSGLILMTMGLAYGAFALGICSDRPLVVLVRRELSGFFLSPVAYLVIVAMILMAWYHFIQFVHNLTGRGGVDEPIVRTFIVELFPVILQMVIVPLLTMRLLSEENRTGTLEMLLTAPVNEGTVTLSKFLAAWIFYQITWLPSWLFLVALRVMGADEFDYRPILSFYFAVAATGAGFVAMGLFFSSVSRNQIIAAVLTFVGMAFHLAFFFLSLTLQRDGVRFWGELFQYVSFVDLWFNTLEGVLAPRFLVFHLSAAVFFLFLTNKVLESRKWK